MENSVAATRRDARDADVFAVMAVECSVELPNPKVPSPFQSRSMPRGTLALVQAKETCNSSSNDHLLIH